MQTLRKATREKKQIPFLHLIPKEKILRTTASYISLMFAYMRNRWNRYTLSIWKHLWRRKNLRADFGQCYILEIQYSTVLHPGERGSTNPLCTKHWTLAKNWKTIFSICILPIPKSLNSLLQGYFPVTHLEREKNTYSSTTARNILLWVFLFLCFIGTSYFPRNCFLFYWKNDLQFKIGIGNI